LDTDYTGLEADKWRS